MTDVDYSHIDDTDQDDDALCDASDTTPLRGSRYRFKAHICDGDAGHEGDHVCDCGHSWTAA